MYTCVQVPLEARDMGPPGAGAAGSCETQAGN